VPKKIKSALLLLVLIATSSCSVPNSINSKVKGILSTNAVEENTPAATSTPAQTSAETAQPEQTATLEPVESFVIPSMDLSQFQNYRSSFTLHFEGMADNVQHFQNIAITQEVDLDSQVRHVQLEIDSDKDLAVQAFVDLYFFNNQIYLNNQQSSGFPCLVISDQNTVIKTIEAFQPEDYFQGIEVGSLIESGVKVNGVLTDHYEVRKAGIDLNNVDLQHSEIWLAQDGGNIIRFTGQVDADLPANVINGNGIASWEYNLEDINQVEGLQVPTDCLQQLQPTEDIPIPPNATELQTLAGIITFNSPDSPEVVGEYYRQHLPVQDWKITNDTPLAEMVMMSASRTGQSLQILITPGKTGGSAVIMSTAPLE
jgi:hypothetical protein